MKIHSGAILTSYKRLKDRSVSISFNLGEKSPSDCLKIDQAMINDSMGYLVFKAEETLTKKELDEIDELETDLYDHPKTQSQRLRNVLFINWKEDNKGFDKFKDYYKSETEKIIEHYKQKLPERV